MPGGARGCVTSLFLELLLAAILDGRRGGAGRIIQNLPDYSVFKNKL